MIRILSKEYLEMIILLVEEGIRSSENYVFDFVKCLKNRVSGSNKPYLTLSDLRRLAVLSAKDLKDGEKVLEIYDEATVGWIENFIPEFVECIFGDNKELIASFFKKGVNIK